MSYEKQTWVDGFSPLNAERMNHMEDGIFASSAANITETVRGDVITISDSSDKKLSGLRIYGKTIQNGTPTPEASVPLQSVGDDGSVDVTICGKNLFTEGIVYGCGLDKNFGQLQLTVPSISPADKPAWGGVGIRVAVCPNTVYTVSTDVNPCKYFTVTFYRNMAEVVNKNNAISFYASPTTNKCTFTTPDECFCAVITAVYNLAATFTWSYWQCEIGSTFTGYEHPKESQTLTISTPNGLPGIPVTSGGNYTDETGQQWVCDEVDFSRGVYVQRVHRQIFDGSELWKNGLVSTGDAVRPFTDLSVNIVMPPDASSKAPAMCDSYNQKTPDETWYNAEGFAVNDKYNRVIFYDSAITSISAWKTRLTAAPINCLFLLATPIETPLSAEELAAYAVLHTNYPNTTIFNNDGARMEATLVTDTKQYIDWKVTNNVNYSAYGLPVLYLFGNTDLISKDNAVILNYEYGFHRGTASVKWQGSSSLIYPKKNYTIKFDKEFEAVEGWGAHSKYCLKANYIDFSHARNVVSAKLWGQIVKSRATVPTHLVGLPNGGAIDGFPVCVVINNEYQGLYTFNIPKDSWLFGMGTGENECIICANNGSDATWFAKPALVDGSDFEIEYISNESNTESVKASLNRLINAVINSDGTDIDTVIAQYADIDSVIDYAIFIALISAFDVIGKNYLLATYDSNKWYISVYDMDSTYGLHWQGNSYFDATIAPTFTLGCNGLARLIIKNKAAELKARYKELRSGILSETNVTTMFANFITRIPARLLMKDTEIWPLLPGTATNNLAQIVENYRQRAAILDAEIEALTAS